MCVCVWGGGGGGGGSGKHSKRAFVGVTTHDVLKVKGWQLLGYESLNLQFCKWSSELAHMGTPFTTHITSLPR